ncbi:serine hydrolase domain-containing protein [Homoserinimonas sp. A520]
MTQSLTPLTDTGSRATLGLENWQDAPHNRWTYSRVSEFVPAARISRHPQVATDERARLPRKLADALPDLDARLAESYTDAFLVVTDGKVVDERYAEGFQPHDQHLLMSVSKSICGLVVGTLVDEGALDVNARVEQYVPELAGTGYGDATVQQVLDMTVDVEYDEDYTNQNSHVQAQDRVAGWRPSLPGDPADTYEFLTSLRSGAGDHGRRFLYCSAGTDVLAWIIENVTGLRYAEAVSRRLWSRLDCQDEASITVDAGGFAFANGGISCTARDLALVGRLMLDGGVAGDRRVVSEEWVRSSCTGGDSAAAEGSAYQQVHADGAYSNQWWVTNNERGNFYASGIHGQFIWADPQTNTVVVKFSSCPEPVTVAWNKLHSELFMDVCQAVEGLR